MWIFLSDSFVSAVQDTNNRDGLCVRARKREHLERLFPRSEILAIPGRDYASRVFVSKSEFTDTLARRVEAIGYTNFKNSVRESGLHDLCEDVWQLHRTYQLQESGRSGPFRR